jgi:exodeoxyribonuclease V gamma subunit
LIVRHALQPFSPAAFGAALPEERQGDTRRFSYDARWHPAADAAIGNGEREVFAPARPLRQQEPETIVSLAQLRGALMRPHEFYLQQGVGLRLPEEEAALEEHEPFGTPDALTRYGLRQRVFDTWCETGQAPDAQSLQSQLLARGLLAPGADGMAVLQGVIEEVAPFAEAAVQAGFAGASDSVPFELPLREGMLMGALDRIHPQGVFRAALNPNGRHGGHALRHGLDWLVASTRGLPLHELSAEKKGAAPRILVRPALPPADAQRALSALQALRRYGMGRPLCFLPKSGYAWWLTAQADPGRALAEAQKVWGGGDDDFGGPGEAQAATLMALRGRDPFLDGDADSLDAFELLSHLIFSAVERGEAFDEEALTGARLP